MDPIMLFLLSLGLAMDCFAVSMASGTAVRKIRFFDALKVAFFFGLFQSVMTAAGWLGGVGLQGIISSFDHWVAFGLLAIIGAKMIYEALEEHKGETNPLKLKVLLLLAIATSIDALAIGVSLAIIEKAIYLPILVIGGVSFAMSFAGMHIGARFGHIFERKTEVLGGLILIGIGLKILLEHLGVI